MKRRSESKPEAEQIREEIMSPPEKKVIWTPKDMISTGSTLLDLAITGKEVRGGGIPKGIIFEVYGKHSAGKTTLLLEIGSNVEAKGGETFIQDPEGRLNQAYTSLFDLEITDDNYNRPDTVTELFDSIEKWEPKSSPAFMATDSLASLSTDLEMEDEDKMGMRRAKEFSQGLRKTARLIANSGWIIGCSNQLRESQSGAFTPGGKGIPYYASLRIELKELWQGGKIYKQKKIAGKDFKKVIGVRSEAIVTKSSLDDPLRRCNISIMFDYGVDDIRENLQYIKEMEGRKKYFCLDYEYADVNRAVAYIEKNNYENDLRERVIDLWLEVQEKFKIQRKKKRRG